jgi:hypothetical protein
VLKDKRGVKVGEIRDGSGGKLSIYDARGVRLGDYDPKSDVTRDARGVKVSQGNTLASLLVKF